MVASLFYLVGAPIARALGGWMENAFSKESDGGQKITWPEWKELVKTVFKLGVPGMFLFYGLDVPVEFAASIPVLADYALNWFGKKINKK